jgi:hypothetical protein
MAYKKIVMELGKKIARVAHDHKKRDLIEWANRTTKPPRMNALGPKASSFRLLF